MLLLFKIVLELIFDEIINVILVGILVLIRLVIIFIDGCCVVINIWIL